MKSKELMLKEIDYTVEWLRKKVKEARCKGLAVGISGGIDSAVVAALNKKAFPDNHMTIILPCGSNNKDEIDALALVEQLNLNMVRIDLTKEHASIYANIQSQLENFETSNNQLTNANLKARLRMSTIYGVSNTMNYLVCGTDNAAEVYTGYFTKYGDGGVDLVPICNLTKREVFEWAKLLNVPQQIINRAPSAGLWDGQTDEDEMGTTYDMIDDLLEGKEIPQRDKEIIEALHAKSEHKRQLPPGPPVFKG